VAAVSHPNTLAFEFARRMRDPVFRERIQRCGWTNGMTVYTALPWETAPEVKTRMEPGRHLLVMPDPDAPFGMSMIVCEVEETGDV
jgi:hypothetical protein